MISIRPDDEVVAQRDARALGAQLDVLADRIEPLLDAGEQLDLAALGEVGAVDAHARVLRLRAGACR